MKSKLSKAMYGKSMMKSGGAKKTVAKASSPKMKMGGAKKPLVKAQKGINTAGQAYMKYVPGATASDTLGTDDIRFRGPGYAEDTSNWKAKEKMLNMTYGEDVSPYSDEPRPAQSPKSVSEYAKALKAQYKQKTGGTTGKYKTGGTVKKMQKGGPNVIQSMRKNMLNNRENRLIDKGVANMKAGNVKKGQAQLDKSNDVGYKRRQLSDKYKTGGMVNSNAKVSAIKTAGSKGVKSGVNTKVTASKVAKGRVGGTSTAPKGATPKAKMGGMMKGKKC
jgi:hypothetical protein